MIEKEKPMIKRRKKEKKSTSQLDCIEQVLKKIFHV